jgi:hypothetical protein
MKTRSKTKSAATLTIHDIPDMTTAGKRAIIRWLERQAEFLRENPGKAFSSRFTARYMYGDS